MFLYVRLHMTTLNKRTWWWWWWWWAGNSLDCLDCCLWDDCLQWTYTRSIVRSVSVCLSVWPQEYLQNHVTDLRRIFMHAASGHGSFLLWRHCDMLCSLLPVLWMMPCFLIMGHRLERILTPGRLPYIEYGFHCKLPQLSLGRMLLIAMHCEFMNNEKRWHKVVARV